MKRMTRNAVKTKQEIIEKSAPVFNVNGFAGTSMQMLVKATGYQMGGIYRHFDTKMDLANISRRECPYLVTALSIIVSHNLRFKQHTFDLLDGNPNFSNSGQ